MTGASDRTTDEHWVVVTHVNDALREFNALLRDHEYEEHSIPQVRFLGNFDVEDVEATLEQRRTKAHIVRSQLETEADAEACVEKLDDLLSQIDTIIEKSGVFD